VKGVLFNHLEELANELDSSEAWRELCETCPIQTKGRFIANQTYPDSDLNALLEGLAKRVEMDVLDAWVIFGKLSIPSLMSKFPEAIARYKNPKELLENINTVHFTKVRDLFSETQLPFFFYTPVQHNEAILKYVSKRKMCHYLEGALYGVGEFFRKPLTVKQTSCEIKGDQFCEFKINYG
jgi:predicted hydrocarbon binding protein